APDSRGLLFISDREGIPNVYRVSVDGAAIGQVTRVGTGIRGITRSSPALSVASGTGVDAFSVYESGKYDIFVTELGRGAAVTTATASTGGARPPLNRDI